MMKFYCIAGLVPLNCENRAEILLNWTRVSRDHYVRTNVKLTVEMYDFPKAVGEKKGNEKSWKGFHYCCMRTVKADRIRQDFKWIFQPINHFQGEQRVFIYENWTWKWDKKMHKGTRFPFRNFVEWEKEKVFLWLIFKEWIMEKQMQSFFQGSIRQFCGAQNEIQT